MATAKKPAVKLKTLAEMGDIQFVSSGIAEIDAITQFPRSRITELYGLQGVGKSYLVMQMLSNISKTGKVLYVDVENALNPERLKAYGGNPKNIIVSDEPILENVADLVIGAVDKYDVIVIDSVASLTMNGEAAGAVGDQFVGLKARLMGQWLRKLLGPLGKSSCAVVFVNQIRESMIAYGDPRFTPGGKALPYAASLRIELKTTKADRLINKEGVVTGHKVSFEITKSRICPPYQKGQFKLTY